MSYYYYNPSGIIYIIIFSIFNLIMLITWVMFNSKTKLFYKRLEEGKLIILSHQDNLPNPLIPSLSRVCVFYLVVLLHLFTMDVAIIVYIVAACILNILMIFSWVSFVKRMNRLYKYLDEGYYFIEDNYRWRRTRLLMVHPSNIDSSLGAPRVINPALIIR